MAVVVESIRADLHATLDALAEIFSEGSCVTRASLSDVCMGHKLRVRVDRDPCPEVARLERIVRRSNAALLLSESPARKQFFPYAKIECARFKGTDKRVFLDQLTIEGPIQENVEPCMAFIKKNIALGATIGEIYRKDRWEYPLEAIREALINAVIHRDYAILGSDIKVAIYDDMLEITSTSAAMAAHSHRRSGW